MQHCWLRSKQVRQNRSRDLHRHVCLEPSLGRANTLLQPPCSGSALRRGFGAGRRFLQYFFRIFHMINDVSLHLSGAFSKSWERRWDQEWVKVDGGLTQEIKTWRDELQRSASARHQDRVRCRGGRGTTGLSLEIPSVGRLHACPRTGLPRRRPRRLHERKIKPHAVRPYRCGVAGARYGRSRIWGHAISQDGKPTKPAKVKLPLSSTLRIAACVPS